MKKLLILSKVALQGILILVILAGLGFIGMGIYKGATGASVPSGDKEALAHHIKECAKDKIDNCFDAGVYYSKGQGAPRDTNKAVTYFQRACDLGDKEACEKSVFFSEASKLENDIEGKSIDEMTDDEKKRFRDLMMQVVQSQEGK